MKRPTTELSVHKISALLLIQSALIAQILASASGAKPQDSVPVPPANIISGPTLKFHSDRLAVRDQQQANIKANTLDLVTPDVPDPGQSNSALKPDVIKDVCDRYDVDGCSVPFHLPFFFKKLFTPSCDRHDICYHCGVSHKITRLTCDMTFRDNMRNACKTTDYENKPWNSPSSQKSDKETKEHRVTMQQLIEDKTEFLTDLMENATHDIKKDVGDTLRLLTSPDKVKLLLKNVLVKWAVHLSDLVTGSGKSGQSDNSHKKKHFLLKRHASFERSTARHHKKSVEIFGATEIIGEDVGTKTTSAGALQQGDLCNIILKVADEISMRYQHYRISDILDCEDIFRLECLFNSNLYFLAVRVFGSSSYWKKAENYCDEGFVNACLPHD